METNQAESHVPACDVLVIGSGGAGLRAAIAARERGAEVLVLSKSPLGSASCTMYSGGLFTFSVPGGLSFEEHYQNTLMTGRGLCDKRLAYVLCEEGPEAVRELERFGVSFHYLKTGATTGPLGPPLRGDWELSRAWLPMPKKIGVRAQQDVLVTNLLTDRHGAVVGALGLVDSSGELIICRDKAVVLVQLGMNPSVVQTVSGQPA